jgi:hypothetical protein
MRRYAPGPFCTDPHDRVASLRITMELIPTVGDAELGRDYLKMHVRARSLLVLTQVRQAPPNACAVVPWSEWGPAAARVVAPRILDSDDVYMYPVSVQVFSAPSVRTRGATARPVSLLRTTIPLACFAAVSRRLYVTRIPLAPQQK